MKRRYLSRGITGQDGSYLAELPDEKGAMRSTVSSAGPRPFNTGRIDHIYAIRTRQGVRLLLHYGDTWTRAP